MNPLAFIAFLTICGAAAVLALRQRGGALDDVASASIAYDPADIETVAGPAVVAPSVFEIMTANVKKLFTLPGSAAPYVDAIRAAEVKNSLPEGLLGRVLYQESRFRPEIINGTVRSSVGAQGIAQFMPATAKDLGVDPLDPFSSINGAARYLRQLYAQTGDWARALAAYNWGIGNVQRKGMGAAPLETRNYVNQVLADVTV